MLHRLVQLAGFHQPPVPADSYDRLALPASNAATARAPAAAARAVLQRQQQQQQFVSATN